MIALARSPISLPASTDSRRMSPVDTLGMPCTRAKRSACVPLPAPGGPRNIRFKAMEKSRLAPSSTNAGLLHEAVVMSHNQLRLDLLHGIHCNADDDQQRRAAEEEL